MVRRKEIDISEAKKQETECGCILESIKGK